MLSSGIRRCGRLASEVRHSRITACVQCLTICACVCTGGSYAAQFQLAGQALSSLTGCAGGEDRGSGFEQGGAEAMPLPTLTGSQGIGLAAQIHGYASQFAQAQSAAFDKNSKHRRVRDGNRDRDGERSLSHGRVGGTEKDVSHRHVQAGGKDASHNYRGGRDRDASHQHGGAGDMGRDTDGSDKGGASEADWDARPEEGMPESPMSSDGHCTSSWPNPGQSGHHPDPPQPHQSRQQPEVGGLKCGLNLSCHPLCHYFQ